MQNSGLPEAREDLAKLVSQLNEDPTISSALKEETLSHSSQRPLLHDLPHEAGGPPCRGMGT